jgi:hypothetical protein
LSNTQTEADGISYHAANFGGNAINTTADMGSRTRVAFSLPDPVVKDNKAEKIP